MEMKIFFPGEKKVNIKYKEFIIKTDQPLIYDGENTAPDPFSLFISSIGSCVGFYIISFCHERNIPTKDIELLLKAFENIDTKMIEKINIELKIPKFP